MRFIRSNETTTPSDRGMQAPDSPVPEPRAVIGVPVALAHSTISRAWLAVSGHTIARGVTGSSPSASSWE